MLFQGINKQDTSRHRKPYKIPFAGWTFLQSPSWPNCPLFESTKSFLSQEVPYYSEGLTSTTTWLITALWLVQHHSVSWLPVYMLPSKPSLAQQLVKVSPVRHSNIILLSGLKLFSWNLWLPFICIWIYHKESWLRTLLASKQQWERYSSVWVVCQWKWGRN